MQETVRLCRLLSPWFCCKTILMVKLMSNRSLACYDLHGAELSMSSWSKSTCVSGIFSAVLSAQLPWGASSDPRMRNGHGNDGSVDMLSMDIFMDIPSIDINHPRDINKYHISEWEVRKVSLSLCMISCMMISEVSIFILVLYNFQDILCISVSNLRYPSQSSNIPSCKHTKDIKRYGNPAFIDHFPRETLGFTHPCWFTGYKVPFCSIKWERDC